MQFEKSVGPRYFGEGLLYRAADDMHLTIEGTPLVFDGFEVHGSKAMTSENPIDRFLGVDFGERWRHRGPLLNFVQGAKLDKNHPTDVED